MTTMVEQRPQNMGSYEPYERMHYGASPHFTNPWGSPSGSRQLYDHHDRPNGQYTRAPYHNGAVADNTSTTTDSNREALSDYYVAEAAQRQGAYAPEYSSPAHTGAPFTTPDTAKMESYHPAYTTYEQRYAQYQQQAQEARKQQYAMKPPLGGRDSFHDALDGAQGMVAMSQQEYTTARAPCAPRHNSTDSYGFQSEHDSVSSNGSYPYYGSYTGSVDGSMASSVTDYNSASEDVSQRHSAVPSHPAHTSPNFPPDASQMMTQFNSKLAATAAKKHKCKICDKRFTRPSSLQTHMYSHTGEKPYSCDFEGCGRHFSVVSNLRRHKKCHKGGSVGDADSVGEVEELE